MPDVSYRVFARKYRPRTFEEVVGQEHITRTLQNAIRENRIAQAYLLVGPRGIGKTSTARILAKALNCENGPTPHPCCKCSACLEIAEGNNMDVVEIDGASNNSVENIRDLRDKAQYLPVKGPYKIYLIDEVHMLSIGAFNALLKTLEEPPPHVKFLFATTESHKVPATITSRCQRFDLRRIPDSLIAKHLQFIAGQEGVELDADAADVIARGAHGGLRDAESMFDQVISFCGKKISAADVLDVFGFTAQEIVFSLAGAILRADITQALEIVEKQDTSGKDLTRLIEALVSHLRDLLIVQATGQGDEKLLEVAELVSREKLIELLEHFAAVEGQLRWSTDKRMHVDVSVIKGIHLIEQASLTEVIDTIASLRDGAPPPLAAAPSERPLRAAQTRTATRTKFTSSAPQKQPEKPQAVPAQPGQTDSQPSQNSRRSKEPQEMPAAAELKTKSAPEQNDVSLSNSDAARAWKVVSERLADDSPVFLGWLRLGIFRVESEGRMVVVFPESQRSCLENDFWKNNVARIDRELSTEVGHSVSLHPEFVPDEELPQAEFSAAEEPPAAEDAPPHAPEQTQKPEKQSASASKSSSAAPSANSAPSADKVEEFLNDPLIQKALEIFEGELISSQRS